MKALRFIFLLPLVATAPSSPMAPFFPFQKVVFTVMTSTSITDLTYFWDIERRSLGPAFRQHERLFERQGETFVRNLENAHLVWSQFQGPHPRRVPTTVTGRITFPPPMRPDGILRPGTYRANPATTVSLSDVYGQIDIAYVLVTILPPDERNINGVDPSKRDPQSLRDIIETSPNLPGPPVGPMATGIFAPDLTLRYRLDGNMIQHALDDSLWKMQDRDILCIATDFLGNPLPGRTNDDRAMDLFSFVWNYAAWKLWGDVRVFGLPSTTYDLPPDPIWDCSDEASTSGTKDEPPPRDEPPPHDELRRRRRLFLE
jgi:hypothetical protein